MVIPRKIILALLKMLQNPFSVQLPDHLLWNSITKQVVERAKYVNADGTLVVTYGGLCETNKQHKVAPKKDVEN